MNIPIGTVLHFYENSNWAVIEILNQKLQVGDRIKINNRDSVVEEIKIGSETVSSVEQGDECVIKIPTKAEPGDMVYLTGEI